MSDDPWTCRGCHRDQEDHDFDTLPFDGDSVTRHFEKRRLREAAERREARAHMKVKVVRSRREPDGTEVIEEAELGAPLYLEGFGSARQLVGRVTSARLLKNGSVEVKMETDDGATFSGIIPMDIRMSDEQEET